MQNSSHTELENIKNRTDSEKVKFNKKLLIYLFFLIISTVFWFLTALDKSYTVQLEFPIRYQNFPPEKVLVSDAPQTLKLRISGHGFTIIKHKFYSGLSPLTVDVTASGIAPMDTATQLYYLLTRKFRDKITTQFGEDLQVISIYPDSLFFVLDDIVSKSVPIRPLLHLSFKKQFQQKGKERVLPRSVMVFGPKIIIDTIKWINTSIIKKSSVNDTIREEADLEPIRTLQYSFEKVNVVIPVEKFTEVNLSVPIEVINLPNKLILKTFPGYVTVSGMVAVSDYSKITPDLFRVMVDYQKIGQSRDDKLQVNMMKMPDYMVNIKFTPKNVEYIIEK
jgi:YbbR domain-containing protein